jgi:hypothetical protein
MIIERNEAMLTRLDCIKIEVYMTAGCYGLIKFFLLFSKIEVPFC